ncbi:hypothetical protein QBC38DRAFT_354582 [Podospora fimiseda]|uniref:DUF1993 domain-containing protein n=1 Tax=Podospora fimiseda TaxID=252190 RepID=A0AAN7H407_9PEZI|nr:hypothetical protein QBC38DRAFT_354582 [Podospora fimiseda]
MATITLSSLTLSTFSTGLQTLTHILQKAQSHATSQSLDPDTNYPSARLIEDQLPLTFQIQNATTTIRKTLNRLQGIQDQPWEDTETTFAELFERIEKAKKVIEGSDKEKIDERAGEEVELPLGQTTIKLSARDSVLNQAIPNFYFHLNTAYSILRAKGVPVGKRDYIGAWVGPFLGQ